MARANVQLADGTKVVLEGSPEEVAAFLQRMEAKDSQSGHGRRGRRTPSGPTGSQKKVGGRRAKPKGPADYIRNLIEEDFFKGKRGIAEVRSKLEEQAHIYPVTTLSPALFRLVKSKELRRIKEDGQWRYVNP